MTPTDKLRTHVTGAIERGEQQAIVEVPAHHYFASTCTNWAVAPTRAEAIAKVAKAAGADFIKRNVATFGGLYVWSCRVNTPQEQCYSINNFAPSCLIVEGNATNVAVPREMPREYKIVNTKGHVVVND